MSALSYPKKDQPYHLQKKYQLGVSQCTLGSKWYQVVGNRRSSALRLAVVHSTFNVLKLD